MRKSRDISVELNYIDKKEDLKELESRKARVVINILKEKYDEGKFKEIKRQWYM